MPNINSISSNGIDNTRLEHNNNNLKQRNEFNDQIMTKIKCKNRLKILICTESFHPYTSGIARRMKEIITRLCKQGYLIHIVTGCKGCETLTNDEEIIDKITYSRLYAIEFKDKIDCALPFLIPQYGMLKAILNFKPDIIHCVEHTPATTFCASLALTLKIPIVWSSHTNLDYYIPLYISPLVASLSLRVYQKLRRTYLNLADYNLTVSSDFVKLLNENGIDQKIHVWKTGVDSESFNPSYRSHEMRLRMFNGHYSCDKILLVSVGRLSPEKNFEFLIKILERFPQVFLCIVGGGPYKDSLEPLFPSNQTYFMGFLQGEELASAYASADYFIYASVSETFGQVYLEAMSCGVPIVAAEGGQMKEFFINGIHGYTWKPDDVNSACEALNNAIKNRNILAQNCRSNALNHSWTSAANQIANVYETINTEKSLINKKNELNNEFYLFKMIKLISRSIYYLSIWFYLIILIVLFMLPFMNVAKPNKNKLKVNNDERKKSLKKRRLLIRRRLTNSFDKSSNNSLNSSSSSSSSRDNSQESINRQTVLVYDNDKTNRIKLNDTDQLISNYNELSSNSSLSSSSSSYETDMIKIKKSKKFKKRKSLSIYNNKRQKCYFSYICSIIMSNKFNNNLNIAKKKNDLIESDDNSLNYLDSEKKCIHVWQFIKKHMNESTESLSSFLATLSAFLISLLSLTAIFALCLNLKSLFF